MACDKERIKDLLRESMDKYFGPGASHGDTWRLNLDKLAEIVSNIEDEAYDEGYDNGYGYNNPCQYY